MLLCLSLLLRTCDLRILLEDKQALSFRPEGDWKAIRDQDLLISHETVLCSGTSLGNDCHFNISYENFLVGRLVYRKLKLLLVKCIKTRVNT